MKSLTVCSQRLSPETIIESVSILQRLFLEWGFDSVKLACGYGCNVSIDEMWQYTEVPTAGLGGVVEDLVRESKFIPGKSNLHIEDRNGVVKVRLCDESDIHFESIIFEHVNQVKGWWRERGWTVFMADTSVEDATSVKWVEIK